MYFVIKVNKIEYQNSSRKKFSYKSKISLYPIVKIIEWKQSNKHMSKLFRIEIEKHMDMIINKMND